MHQRYSAHILAFKKDKSFLLVKRKDFGLWVIPGGKSNRGEEPHQTALREFWEETGIELKKRDLLLKAKYSKNNSVVKYLFIAKVAGAKPKLSNETDDCEFFSLNTLPREISRYEKQRILDAVSKSKIIIREDHVDYWSEFWAMFPEAITKGLLFRFLGARIRNTLGSFRDLAL